MTPATGRALRLARLTVRAWVGLLASDLAARAGFRGLERRVRGVPVRPRRQAVDPADVVWAVDEACVWYGARVWCLQRALVTTRLLRRGGVPADLVIGYRPVPFESHAWVEVDGRIVNDRPAYQRAFHVLERL